MFCMCELYYIYEVLLVGPVCNLSLLVYKHHMYDYRLHVQGDITGVPNE